MSASIHRIRRVRAGSVVDTFDSAFPLQRQTTAAEEEAAHFELSNRDEAESLPWPPLHRQNYTPRPETSPLMGLIGTVVLVAVWTALMLQAFGVWKP